MKDVSIDDNATKLFRKLHVLGFRAIQSWKDYDTSDGKPFAVSGVCQDYAVHVACHISAMKSFTYVLSLCLFRVTTFLVFIYFLGFLWGFGILWYTGFPLLPKSIELNFLAFYALRLRRLSLCHLRLS